MTKKKKHAVVMMIRRPGPKNQTILIEEKITPKQDFLDILQQQFPGAKTAPSPPDSALLANVNLDPAVWNYLHDAQYMRKQNRSFTLATESDYVNVCAPPGKGPEGPNGYRALSSKVQITNITSSIRLFCAIYTYDGAKERLGAITETWGKRCDGFMAASNVTDPSVGMVNLYHKGEPGAYNGIWQKVRSMLVYIYRHYLDDYDFYHILGDDTFLIVENLKVFLGELNDDAFVYVGAWTHPFWRRSLPADFCYAGGGPGYTLSRLAVKAFVEGILLACEPDFLRASEEDMLMGWCMREVLGKRPMDDMDEHQAHRYHGLDAEMMQRLGKQGHFVRAGTQFISAQSVAFHQIKSAAKMRRYEKILYRKHIHNDCAVCKKQGEAPDCDGKGVPHDLMSCPNWASIKESILPPGCHFQRE